MLTISDKFVSYGEQVHAELRQNDIRAGLDRSDERIQAKIKAGAEMKIPYLLIVGGKDKEAGTVSVRKRGVGDQGPVPAAEFTAAVAEEIAQRRLE